MATVAALPFFLIAAWLAAAGWQYPWSGSVRRIGGRYYHVRGRQLGLLTAAVAAAAGLLTLLPEVMR